MLKELSASQGCEYTTDPALLYEKDLGVLLEAANPEAVRTHVPRLLEAGISVLSMSVGAFADSALLAAAESAAKQGRSRLLLPTGAIAGLDYLRAAQLVGLDGVQITIIKTPKGLAGAPYFRDHPVDLFALQGPCVVFEGSAADAIRGFPVNVNVAVALSVATIGPEKTRVRVACDPSASQTKFEIHTRGTTGELSNQLLNIVSPENPRTSYQACCSALASLCRFSHPVQVGS